MMVTYARKIHAMLLLRLVFILHSFVPILIPAMLQYAVEAHANRAEQSFAMTTICARQIRAISRWDVCTHQYACRMSERRTKKLQNEVPVGMKPYVSQQGVFRGVFSTLLIVIGVVSMTCSSITERTRAENSRKTTPLSEQKGKNKKQNLQSCISGGCKWSTPRHATARPSFSAFSGSGKRN